MLYEISCTKGNELTVYICRDSSEISDGMFDCGKKLGISQPHLMLSAFMIGPHYASAATYPLEFMGIKFRNLPEEEYEKWQKAF